MKHEGKSFWIQWVHGQTTAPLRAALIQFWRDNGAISDTHLAWRRTFEVGCVALDIHDEIIGVSSIYPDIFQADGKPYWFYRTFIRADFRVIGLAPRVFQVTFDGLLRTYAGEPGSPLGVILVIENPKLELAAGFRLIQRNGLERLGCDERGQSIWRKNFAHLKVPQSRQQWFS